MIPLALLDSIWAACPTPSPSSLSVRRFFATSSATLLAKQRSQDTHAQHSYSDTITLPKTAFPLRANAASREALFRKRTTTELYDWQERQHDRPLFVLHDGPPYANGNLHIGHFMNKTLKDFINRSKLLQGYRVNFIPGYDTHGLPLELKALSVMKVPRASLTPQQIRAAARAEAEKGIALQAEEFQQFGGLGNFDPSHAYKTLNWSYEKRQLGVVREMVKKGLIISHHRPTLYSPSSGTALAEAELEYREDHVSQSVYVACQVAQLGGLEAVLRRSGIGGGIAIALAVWTTTPWTLPSNVAIAVSETMDYSLVRSSISSTYLIVASALVGHLEGVLAIPGTPVRLEVLSTFPGSDLLSTTYHSPLSSTLEHEESTRPVFAASYVTSSSGTGLVHTAPAHGVEDWEAWRSHQVSTTGQSSDVLCAVDGDGKFSELVGEMVGEQVKERLVGKEVLGEGGKAVIKVLEEVGSLLKMVPVTHKYPYDWRTKKPVIFRASSQWFANLEDIKEDAVSALDAVTFYPSRGKKQLEQFVRGRSEWCISRQRAWGVPLPVVYSYPVSADDPSSASTPYLTASNIDHIVSVLDSHSSGSDYWWEGTAEEFVEPAELARSKAEGRAWRKGTDTMDVWFDSGCSWTLLRELGLRDPGAPFADVYIEGGDQHRGWFQSSLLTAISASDVVAPKAPYGAVITHGMVLDEQGRKMSKSLGNVLSPLEVINGGKKSMPAFGVDLLRLWVASVDSISDVPIGRTILDQIFESLRKIRNTARFLLGSLANEPQLEATQVELGLIERYVLNELYELDQTARDGYNTFAFNKVYQALTTFSNSTLSSFYFNVAKDSLYADSHFTSRRRATIFTLQQVLKTYVSVLAPMAPHLAEEIHHFSLGSTSDPSPSDAGSGSVFENIWQPVNQAWKDVAAKKEMEQLFDVRTVVLGLLEQARTDKHLRSSAEARVFISGAGRAESLVLTKHADLLSTLFMVADVRLEEPSNDTLAKASWSYTEKDNSVSVLPAINAKCPRCWLHTRPSTEELCSRCGTAIGDRQ